MRERGFDQERRRRRSEIDDVIDACSAAWKGKNAKEVSDHDGGKAQWQVARARSCELADFCVPSELRLGSDSTLLGRW